MNKINSKYVKMLIKAMFTICLLSGIFFVFILAVDYKSTTNPIFSGFNYIFKDGVLLLVTITSLCFSASLVLLEGLKKVSYGGE